MLRPEPGLMSTSNAENMVEGVIESVIVGGHRLQDRRKRNELRIC